MYYALYAGNKVVVDILISPQSDGTYYPAAGDSSVSHFARVVGIDWKNQTVTMENTTPGENYWTISFDEFSKVWYDPEEMAGKKPSGLATNQIEKVNYWGVTIAN